VVGREPLAPSSYLCSEARARKLDRPSGGHYRDHDEFLLSFLGADLPGSALSVHASGANIGRFRMKVGKRHSVGREWNAQQQSRCSTLI
jgi:hypothetical protein